MNCFGTKASASQVELLRNDFLRTLEVDMNKIFYSSFDSSLLGKVFVASTERGVCMVDFLTSEKEFLKRSRKRFPGEIVRDDQKNRDVMNQPDSCKKY